MMYFMKRLIRLADRTGVMKLDDLCVVRLPEDAGEFVKERTEARDFLT